jgi:hypothetical protein
MKVRHNLPPKNSTGGCCPPPPCSVSFIREKVDAERWFFIADWCKKKGVSPMNVDNFNRADMEWVKLNCFEPNILKELG